MKALLIRPSFGHGNSGGYETPAKLEPLALGILAALTPRHIRVQAFDERFEKIAFDAPADIVALSVDTFSAKRAYQIAHEYTKRGVTVVMGGFHPTLAPDEAMKHADAIAVGDAEDTWPEILADFARGKLKRRYDASGQKSPAVAVWPDRSVFHGKRYLPMHLVQFSRGCNRRCEFCSVRAFYAGKCTYRPVADVVSELKTLSHKRVFFVDDNIISDRSAFKALLEAIVPLGLRWSSQIDLSFADDPELLTLAKRSGCQSLTLGFETLNTANLKQMGKAWNRVDTYTKRLQKLRDAQIMVYGTFVFGYDEDDPSVFSKTVDFAIREKLFIANFNPLQPLPGTPLYARLKEQGRLVYDDWWLHPSYQWHQALIKPRGMSPEQLSDGCRSARERFNSARAIVSRFFGSRAHTRDLENMIVFWASNLVSRLDIKAKSGLHLGSSEEAVAP